MSLESSLFSALRTLVADRVYPDAAPDGVVAPYITYQQVGGQAVNFVEATPVGKRNARMQIMCWADRRTAAADLARSAEDTLMTALQASALGAMTALHEPDLRLYGTLQDFSIWY